MHCNADAARSAAPNIVNVASELAQLENMTVAQLADRYAELMGRYPSSRNRRYLQKRLAWRVQELAEGGLIPETIQRVVELGDALPERWRLLQVQNVPKLCVPEPKHGPKPGTVLRRVYQGTEHVVTVLEGGFEYEGGNYKSLSKIAQEITGTRWNGLVFFGVSKRGAKGGEK